MTKTRFAPTAAMIGLAVLLAGCSAMSGMNPFKQKEKIMPGDRVAVLPQARDDVAGGTPAIDGASGLSDWSQPGGNAANAPGNVSLTGGSAAPSWRVSVGHRPRVQRPGQPPGGAQRHHGELRRPAERDPL